MGGTKEETLDTRNAQLEGVKGEETPQGILSGKNTEK